MLSVLALIALLLIVPALPAFADSITIGTDLSSLKFLDLGGYEKSLSDFHGKIVIISFVAFWCDTYKEVVEGYEQLQRDVQGAPVEYGLIFIDSRQMDASLPILREILLKSGPVFVFRDKDETAKLRFSITSVPIVVILDKHGKIRYFHRGYPSNGKMKEEIFRLQN